MSRWRAIVFDLDDTLYPEQEYIRSGFQAVSIWVEENLQVPREEAFREFWDLFSRGVRGNTFNKWLDGCGLSDGGFVQALVNVYRVHDPEIKPYPDIRSLLEELKRNTALGLLSDGYLEVQKRKFSALGISEYFDVVVFSDEWGRTAWKPSPRPFQEIVRKLVVQPHEAVYVADNPTKDFLGAREVGMATIRVRWKGGLYAHLEPPTPQHAPDYVIYNLEEIKTLL